MNLAEARQCLTIYWALICQAQQQPWLSKERRATAKKINELLPAVNSILRALAPDITPINAYLISDHAAAGARVHRALRLLDGSQEITAQQWTGGGPALPLSLLDPTVRDAALPLWAACKYRQAVNDAATSLTSYAQTRTSRHDISDKDLMAQLFSSDPPQGAMRSLNRHVPQLASWSSSGRPNCDTRRNPAPLSRRLEHRPARRPRHPTPALPGRPGTTPINQGGPPTRPLPGAGDRLIKHRPQRNRRTQARPPSAPSLLRALPIH